MHPRRKGVFGSFRCSQFGRMMGFNVHTSRWCMWESCYISHLVTMTKWEFCCISHLVTMTKWEFCETCQDEPDSPTVVWRVLWHIRSGRFTPSVGTQPIHVESVRRLPHMRTSPIVWRVLSHIRPGLFTSCRLTSPLSESCINEQLSSLPWPYIARDSASAAILCMSGHPPCKKSPYTHCISEVASIYTYTHTHARTHVHVHIHCAHVTHAHPHVHTHTHTYIRTHTYTHRRLPHTQVVPLVAHGASGESCQDEPDSSTVVGWVLSHIRSACSRGARKIDPR